MVLIKDINLFKVYFSKREMTCSTEPECNSISVGVGAATRVGRRADRFVSRSFCSIDINSGLHLQPI